ncbi:MAG: hypothetical protein QF465_11560 [SAR202 cluster bacterium]|nr:hypothetical protein [SAR202 cluster bacterium]
MNLIRVAIRLAKAWPLVVRRAIASWRLLSTVVIGVLMACAIMAGTVIYFDALKELALKNALNQLTEDETNILVKSDRGPTTRTEAANVARVVNLEIDRRAAWLLEDRIFGMKSATYFVTDVGDEAIAGDDNRRAFFFHVPTFYEHITILPGGRVPVDQPIGAPGEPITLEVIAPVEAAEAFGVSLEGQLSTVAYWGDHLPIVRVKVVGLYEKNDPDDQFWHLEERILRASTSGSFTTIPFLLSEETYFDVLGATYKQLDTTYGWLLVVDTDRLNAGNATFARASIEAMRRHLQATLFSYRQITELVDTIEEYDTRLFFSKLPMFIILVLIAVVILYYVVTMSSLLVEQQRSEIVLLRSRGSTSAQVLSVFVLEGATIAVLAVFVAPVLAAIVISFLGYTPAFSDLSGNGRLVVSLSSSAFLMSAVGGVFSFVALLVPAIQASRVTVATHRQESARPGTQPFYQRYYLDVLLLAAGILLFRQLSQQGSVVAVSIFGAVAVDQVLLAVPAVILVASALVLLRLFPLTMRIASRLLSPVLPAGLVIGLWQMARYPTHYARLSLLLILMAGLGIFAASFGGTLERSFEERARYSTGADIRMSGVLLDSRGTSRPVQATFEALPAVRDVGLAFRGFGSDLSRMLGDSYTMFAMEGDAIMDIGWFRSDFSEGPMRPKVTNLSNPTPPKGIVLPDGADTIGVSIKPDRIHPSVALAARLKDVNDRYFTYTLGTLDSNQWLELEAGFARVSQFRRVELLQPVAPLKLVSLTVHETNSRNRLRAGSVAISEVYAKFPDGEVQTIESFDSTDRWNIMKAAPESESDIWRAFEDPTASDGIGTFIWAEGSPLMSRGVFHGPPIVPVDVVATKSFLRINNHAIGDTFQVSVQGHRIDVSLVDEVEYFPTLETHNKSYLIGDLDSISEYANLDANNSELKPNEIWLTTDDPAERVELVDMLIDDKPFLSRVVHDREQMFNEAQVDPLIDAGWNALLFVAFSAVFILSGLGFLVHAYVSFKSREVQFALMRTIGFTMKQLMALVFLEQVLVIGAGLALGTWMGDRLGAVMMPYLSHDDMGIQVLPPFIVEVNWDTLAVVYGAMALLFALIIGGVIWFVRRISLQRILRLGEV